MQKLIISLLLFISTLTQGQDSAITYSGVVAVEGVSQAELFSRAEKWFATTYKNAQKVLQMKDKESGVIVGKGNSIFNSRTYFGSLGTKGVIGYTITIQVKEGRYRFEITDFIHEGNPYNEYGAFSFGLLTSAEDCPVKVASAGKKWRNTLWDELKEKAADEAALLIVSVYGGMTTAVKKDDW